MCWDIKTVPLRYIYRKIYPAYHIIVCFINCILKHTLSFKNGLSFGLTEVLLNKRKSLNPKHFTSPFLADCANWLTNAFELQLDFWLALI